MRLSRPATLGCFVGVVVVWSAACTLTTSLDGLSGGAGSSDGGDAATDANSESAVAACDAATTSSDPNNCGSCGHSCLGGTCGAGACGPVTVVQEGNAHFWGVAAGEQGIVFTDNAGFDQPSRVLFAKADGSGQRVIGNSSTAPAGIALDGMIVYLVTEQDAQLHSQRLDDAPGPAVPIGNGKARGCLILSPDAKRLYFTHGDEVRALLFGGAPVAVALDAAEPQGVAVSSTSLFWTNRAGEVWRAQLDGGARQMLTAGEQSPRCMAVDGDNLYWANHGAGKIVKWSLASGTQATIATDEEQPISVAVDAVSVWWTTTTKIRRLAK